MLSLAGKQFLGGKRMPGEGQVGMQDKEQGDRPITLLKAAALLRSQAPHQHVAVASQAAEASAEKSDAKTRS
jgi:hypothetical protein